MKFSFLFTIALAFVALASQGCQAQNQSNPTSVAVAPAAKVEVKNISGDEFLKLRAENPKVQVLDVRTPEEVAEGFIEGAAKFNVHDAEFTEKVEQNLSKSAPVVVYCAAGGRSARASDILAQQGFVEVYNLTGGVNNWKAEGKPLVK